MHQHIMIFFIPTGDALTVAHLNQLKLVSNKHNADNGFNCTQDCFTDAEVSFLNRFS